MLRAILAVVGGYLTMFLFVLVSFSIAFAAIGVDGAFHGGSYEVSGSWIAVSIVLGLVAAILGGWVCARVALEGSRAPLFLVGLVLVLGILLAVPVLLAPEDPSASTRPEGVTTAEAMQNARQPGWVALLNPFLGAVGVLVGARLRGGGES